MYAMEYYSAIKKNKTMPFAATWMDLEILIGEGNGNPLQCSGLENSIDCIYSPRGCKESNMTE